MSGQPCSGSDPPPLHARYRDRVRSLQFFDRCLHAFLRRHNRIVDRGRRRQGNGGTDDATGRTCRAAQEGLLLIALIVCSSRPDQIPAIVRLRRRYQRCPSPRGPIPARPPIPGHRQRYRPRKATAGRGRARQAPAQGRGAVDLIEQSNHPLYVSFEAIADLQISVEWGVQPSIGAPRNSHKRRVWEQTRSTASRRGKMLA